MRRPPLALGLLSLLAGCDPAGVGRTAHRYDQASDVLMHALGAYYADHGHYPDRVGALYPNYLHGPPQGLETHGIPRFSWLTIDGRGLEYRQVGDEYEVSFEYTGPAINRCHFSPSKGPKWHCHGYY